MVEKSNPSSLLTFLSRGQHFLITVPIRTAPAVGLWVPSSLRAIMRWWRSESNGTTKEIK
jgi:hypothetical protein